MCPFTKSLTNENHSTLRWAGPISLTLFVPDVEFAVARVFIQFLRKCYPAVRERVGAHIPGYWVRFPLSSE